MTDVNRRLRRGLFRTVLLGLHEPTHLTSSDAVDRRNATGAAMDLLDYVEGLETELEQTRIRLMHSEATRTQEDATR